MPPLPSGPTIRLTGYWLVFAISISAFILDFVTAGHLPGMSVLLHIIGLVPCGFSWLLARTLFRVRGAGEIWPEVIVATLYICCLCLYLDPTDQRSGLLGYIGHIQGFLGSAMLLMILVEALDGTASDVAERRFRWSFTGGYLALVATSFVFRLPELASIQAVAQTMMACFALAGATIAWRYRLRHPLETQRQQQRQSRSYPAIATQIRSLMEEDALYLDAGIKVSDVAERLGEPDYKVSQSIVNDLGYPNFNQLLNHHRLEAAKAQLADPDNTSQPILTIAMDCGFGSLGPFNRAFKAQTGMTPTAYRRSISSQP
ncbi:MAG: AraC family transcriptional regulator [Wenzhouxiangellaceae bacterium]